MTMKNAVIKREPKVRKAITHKPRQLWFRMLRFSSLARRSAFTRELKRVVVHVERAEVWEWSNVEALQSVAAGS